MGVAKRLMHVETIGPWVALAHIRLDTSPRVCLHRHSTGLPTKVFVCLFPILVTLNMGKGASFDAVIGHCPADFV